ncbi:N-acetyltransferase family protein [Isoptericola sp. NPDC055881]
MVSALPPAPLTVRRAAASDVDVALPLFLGYLDFYGTTHPPERARAFLAARLEAGESVLFLAESGDQAVGLAQVYPTFSSLGLRLTWTLNDLFVDPAARGTGAGRALVRAVADAARAAGARHVALSTARTNSRAQSLYEDEGFVRDDEFLGYVLPLG